MRRSRMMRVQEDRELLPHRFAVRGDRFLEQIVLNVGRQVTPDLHDRFAQRVRELVLSPT